MNGGSMPYSTVTRFPEMRSLRRYIPATFAVFGLATASTHAQTPVVDAVVGQVLDEKGRPIAGAEVSARYQSNPGGVSISRAARTDREGRYRIDLRLLPGVWTIHAKVKVATGSGTMTVDLFPDNRTPFAGNVGAVRNFRLRFVDGTADDSYGAGGMIVVASAIGDYTPLDEVTVTLHALGDSSAVEHRLRNTGEGWVVTGLRPQSYRVSASHRGRPMLVSPALTPNRDYDWQPAYTGAFERTGPGIYQMRVEVRSR